MKKIILILSLVSIFLIFNSTYTYSSYNDQLENKITSFPKEFWYDSSTGNTNFLIVTGSMSPESLQYAQMLSEKIFETYGLKGDPYSVILKDVELNTATNRKNLVLVGGPVYNGHVLDLMAMGASSVDWARSLGECEYVTDPYAKGVDVIIAGRSWDCYAELDNPSSNTAIKKYLYMLPKDFWISPSGTPNFFVVFGSQADERTRGYCEFIADGIVEYYYPGVDSKSVLKSDLELNTATNRKNLVLVGGPVYNSVIRDLVSMGAVDWEYSPEGVEYISDPFAKGIDAVIVWRPEEEDSADTGEEANTLISENNLPNDWWIDTKTGDSNIVICVGEVAAYEDFQSAYIIASEVTKKSSKITDPFQIIMKDSDFKTTDSKKNLVLVGGPIYNSIVRDLINMGASNVDWSKSSGEWEYLEDPFGEGYDVLIFAGSDREKTRVAAETVEGNLNLDIGKNNQIGECVPSLIFPPNDYVMDNGRFDSKDSVEWDFRWEGCNGAESYQLYVIKKGIPNPVLDILTPLTYYNHIGEGAYIPNSNLNDWTWKVRAKISGQWTDWSEINTFIVEEANKD